MSDDQLQSVGLCNERVQIHKDLIEPIKKADKALQELGYQIYISEGYRSKELYNLINEKISARIGEEETNKILNMTDMPHTTGKSIDVALYKDGAIVKLHNKEDGINGYFTGFYKDKNLFFYETQKKLIEIMQSNGFELGTKGEYFHFIILCKSIVEILLW
jgi:D-alanyl-D-alanine dipeptidase